MQQEMYEETKCFKLQHQGSYCKRTSILKTTNTEFFRAPAGNCPTKYEYKSTGDRQIVRSHLRVYGTAQPCSCTISILDINQACKHYAPTL